MKKIFNYLAAIILLLAVSSCEKADYTLSDSVKHIAFDGEKGTLSEAIEITEIVGNDTIKYDIVDTIRIPVYFTTKNVNQKVTAKFNFGGTAVEGENYTITNKDNFELNGTDIFNYIEIITIDNNVINGDKTIEIEIAEVSDPSVNIGIGGKESNTFTVNIIDDEHPLAHLFGDYIVEGNSLRYEETYSWESTFLSVTGSTTELDIQGLWDGFAYNPIRAKIDLENNTFTIPAGQIIATDATYGDVFVVYVEKIDGERIVDTKKDIVGTINADGTITVSNYGFYVNSASATGFFDWFGTSIFTKK